MNKIKFADFLAVAKGLGYSGGESAGDTEAIRAFIVSKNVEIKNQSGSVLDMKALVVESEPIVIKTTEAQPETKAVNTTDDVETIVKSKVDAALKAAGVGSKTNPNAAVSDVSVTVTPVEEVIYNGTRKHFRDYKTACRFRDLLLSKIYGSVPEYMGLDTVKSATKRWNEHPTTKAYVSSNQAAGGALTFMEFIPDLIANVLQYGVSRKLAQVWPMNQEQAFIPKMTGIHTLTYPQQASTASQSTGVNYSNVALTAKTGITIVKASRQLVDDANILVVDNIFQQIARTVAYTEDQELLTANGEATLGGCIGVVGRFTNIGITSAAGCVAGGGSMSAHTMTNIATLMGKLPNYAREGAVFVCNPYFQSVLIRLAAAQGGVTWTETQQYGYVPMFLGKPVLDANVLNATDSTGTNTIDLLYGDFKRACAIGDRMGLQLDVSDQRYWDDYSIGIRGVIRHDVVTHDVGDTSNAGPVVALYQT